MKEDVNVRLKELLEKRKNLTASIIEEEELINLSEFLTKEQLDEIDPELLTYSNSYRLQKMQNILDDIINTLDKWKKGGEK